MDMLPTAGSPDGPHLPRMASIGDVPAPALPV
jgi:hypothetical protein